MYPFTHSQGKLAFQDANVTALKSMNNMTGCCVKEWLLANYSQFHTKLPCIYFAHALVHWRLSYATHLVIIVAPNANISSLLPHQLSFTMAITQFRLFKICTCLASLLSFFKRLICRWAHLIHNILFHNNLINATMLSLFTYIDM